VTDERPTDLAGPGQAVDELLERLLGELPGTPPASEAESLNIPEALPLEQQRECIVYGLDEDATPLTDSRFTAVIFRVGRYRFAVPLNMLDSVTRVEGAVTSLVGQPPWHRGLARHRGQQLTLVDLAALLGLEDVEAVSVPDHLLVLPGGRAGIVCDEAPEPLELTGDRIRWTRPVLQRPWLAALLPDQMCVLMDVEEIARQIGHESCL
jgi:purine-binding chemotaxis protein CheW